jgi:Peptidase inhibitor I78 family
VTRLPAFALLLAACASVPPAEAEETPVRGAGHCDATKAQGLIGEPRSEAVGDEARRLSGAGALRWLPQGSIVTMEYRADRLNLHLDRDGRIVRIACG